MFDIVMPVYNSEDTVVDSIQSILDQTYNEWHLILVDDGSTDNCGAICDDFANKQSNITVIHKDNGGPASARNEALKHIDADHIIFIDADDRLEKDALENLSLIVANNNPDLILFSYSNDERIEDSVTEKELRLVENKYYQNNDEFKKDYNRLDELFMTYPIWNKVYKSEIIKNNKIEFPVGISTAEDFIFNLRVYEKINNVETIEKKLYHYIFEANSSMTQQFRKDKLEIFKKVYYLSAAILSRWLPEAINNVKDNFLHEINIYVNNMFNKNCTLTNKEKRKIVKEMVNDREIKDIIYDTNPKSSRHKIVKFLFMKKMINGFLLVGRISRIGKSY